MSAGYGTVPPPPPPPPPPAPPAAGGGGGARSPQVVAIVAAVVVGVLLLGAAVVGAVHALGDDGSDRAIPLPSPIGPTLPPASTGSTSVPPKPLGTITPTTAQCNGGVRKSRDVHGPRMTGGGLSVPTLLDRGFRYSPNAALGLFFASDAVATAKEITTDWVSVVAVGGLRRANGFRTPQAAARTVMTCVANDPRSYQGVTAFDEVDGHRTTVDGHPAYDLTENIRVHQAGLAVPGDTVRIVVVDTGNRQNYGLFLMMVPIGDRPLLALQNQAAAQLRVE